VCEQLDESAAAALRARGTAVKAETLLIRPVVLDDPEPAVICNGYKDQRHSRDRASWPPARAAGGVNRAADEVERSLRHRALVLSAPLIGVRAQGSRAAAPAAGAFGGRAASSVSRCSDCCTSHPAPHLLGELPPAANFHVGSRINDIAVSDACRKPVQI